MKPLNPNFCFTVKLNGRHVGGEFQYMPQLAGMIKMRLRGLSRRRELVGTEQTVYLRPVRSNWILWDVVTNQPAQSMQHEHIIYHAFREAYGLAMIHE